MSQWFTDNELLIQSALAMTLLAYSLQVALRSGVFSLAGVGFWAIGGYTTAYLVVDKMWATVTAIIVALLISVIVAIILALVFGRLRSLYLAMSTVAFTLLIQVVAINWEAVTGGAAGKFGIPVTITTWQLVLLIIVVSIGLFYFERGPGGRRVEALRLDEQLALSLGINVSGERIKIFVISSALGCLSGAVTAMQVGVITPDQAGFQLIVLGLMMVVVGGTGAWWGPLLGAFIVSWLPDILRFAGEYRSVLQAAIVIVILLWLPEGIVGIMRKSLRRWRKRRSVGNTA